MAFVGIGCGVLRSRRVSVCCCAEEGKKSVLVVGASGKLGRLVVEELLRRKMSVVGLARDRDRAKEAGLGDDLEGLDMRFGTFEDGSAVEAVEAVKEDVGAVIWAAGPSRTSPSAIVDNQAVNDVAGKFKDLLAGKDDYLFDFENSSRTQSFRQVDDVVMGGVSRSTIQSASEGNEQYARFQGNVSFDNNGGFCAIRNDFSPPLDLSKWTGIVLQVRGDGKRYKMSIKVDEEMEFNYQAKFTTSARSTGQPWETIRIPFSRFTPMKRGRLQLGSPEGRMFNVNLDPSKVVSVGFLRSSIEGGSRNPEFETGPFRLDVRKIGVYKAVPPRFVLLSSAAVTRPFWSKEKKAQYPSSYDIPIVQLNPGNVLVEKFNGEQQVRKSGIPYAIIRYTGLNDDQPDGTLVLAQGDTLVGRINRKDGAKLAVDVLMDSDAYYKTFETMTITKPSASSVQSLGLLSLDIVDSAPSG